MQERVSVRARYVLQVAYAESVFLFLMFAALAAMMARRYAVMLPFAVLACFAHPGGGIVLAAALALQRLRIGARHEVRPRSEKALAWTAVSVIGIAGILLVLAVLVGFAVWFTRPFARRLGSDIRGCTLSWVAYLVAVFLPQQSLFRMLLPPSPLLGHPALSSSAPRRAITLVVGLVPQPVGILLFWVIWPP
ncbi:MAG: hypothetical protein V4479_10590 [Actinomycetota bacterium]